MCESGERGVGEGGGARATDSDSPLLVMFYTDSLAYSGDLGIFTGTDQEVKLWFRKRYYPDAPG